MRILVAGASGLIGHRLTRELLRRGHDVIAASRARGDLPVEVEFLPVDYTALPSRVWWTRELQARRVDAVVNAVGILKESKRQSFESLHARAPCELFHGCASAGVRVVVQVSSLGSDRDAESAYHLSKREADECLRALDMPAAIVQPSLVFAPSGASTQLFARLAALPLQAVPASAPLVQPVHIEDVIEGIVRILESQPVGVRTVAFVGPNAMTLDQYLARLRTALAFASSPWILRIPDNWFAAAGLIAGRLRLGEIDSDTVAMLLRGNASDSRDFASLLGRAPQVVPVFDDRAAQANARTNAVLDLFTPLLRVSVGLVWLWTAVVSAGLFPIEGSLALLADFGLTGSVAAWALAAGVIVDLAMGILTFAAPGRWRPWVWMAQLAVIAGYTFFITLQIPHWWLHPFGPITKNLPMLAVIGLLWALESRRR